MGKSPFGAMNLAHAIRLGPIFCSNKWSKPFSQGKGSTILMLYLKQNNLKKGPANSE